MRKRSGRLAHTADQLLPCKSNVRMICAVWTQIWKVENESEADRLNNKSHVVLLWLIESATAK